jgi:hypothetical protein
VSADRLLELDRRRSIISNSFNLGRALMLARKPVDRALRARVISAMRTPHHVDAYIELLDSAWSLREVRARIARVQPEACGATSLWLQPNENWRGFRAGQYVSAAVCIDGVRHTRCFSISSAHEDGSLILSRSKLYPAGGLDSGRPAWHSRATSWS